MKKDIRPEQCSVTLTEMLKKGILLNTKRGDKFNSMVIGWGNIGTLWGKSVFTVYVRDSRFTKEMIDDTEWFTISCPLEKIDPLIQKVCGSKSGRDIDKVKEAGLTLEEPRTGTVPGIKEYPLTLECRIVYRQKQELDLIPGEVINRMYMPDESGFRDMHTMYIGEIKDAYIIE
ncbi:MAG: flavin reductase [Clostridia bacterium]|nr:flavin reductase [Clostridia bacterium]